MSTEKIMEQAQVFASAWSVVGGPFDGGDAMEVAAQDKAELKRMVGVLAAERDALVAKLKDAEHDRDEFRRVMNGFAEKMAELEGQEPALFVQSSHISCAKYSPFLGRICQQPFDGIAQTPYYARPVPADQPVNARLLETLSALLDDIEALIGESAGVYGLHLNGDVSPWSELEEGGRFERLSSMSRAREAIAAAAAAHTDPVNARLLDALKGLMALSDHRVDLRDEAKAARSAIAAAEAQQERLLPVTVPTEPVNARLLTALKACRHKFAQYVAHHISKGDMHKAMANESMVAMADVAIMAAEAAPRAARLTHSDIAKALASAGLKPEDYREDGEILPLVVAIESAALRKNGLALED